MSLAELVEVRCALCGAPEREALFQDGPFGVWRCNDCELVYVSPRVPDGALLGSVYDASYWNSPAPRERGYADYLGDGDLAQRTWDRRLRVLRPHLRRAGTVLDVGCAAGHFLERARRAGHAVFGIEPSPLAHAAAGALLGPERVRHGDLKGFLADRALGRLERWPERFDLITLWDVLEHLPDPLACLRRCRRLLEPGGLLVVETQDVASPVARLLGRRWHHYKHAEHLVHFDRATLGSALERARLAPVRWTRRGAGKYVRLDFAVERAERLSPQLARGLRPLLGLGNPALYVNPMDEWIVLARPV